MFKKEKKWMKKEKKSDILGKILKCNYEKKYQLVIWRKLLKALNLWGTFKWIAQYDVQFVQINRKTKSGGTTTATKSESYFILGNKKKKIMCSERKRWMVKERDKERIHLYKSRKVVSFKCQMMFINGTTKAITPNSFQSFDVQVKCRRL